MKGFSSLRPILGLLLLLVLVALACNFPTTQVYSPTAAAILAPGQLQTPVGATAAPPTLPPTRDPNQPLVSPTADAPHTQPTLAEGGTQYFVQPGDTLGYIAQSFGVSVQVLVSANQLADPNQLEVGQLILIPAPDPSGVGPDFKIIPDSELVNGPAAIYFDPMAFIESQPGYLKSYTEEIDDQLYTGAQILVRVTTEYSVNPRLLLALLEYQSGWLSDANPRTATLEYPIGFVDPARTGLFRQLSWAADRLNEGYYLWKSGTAGWHTLDGGFVPAAATINAGTAAIQNTLAFLYTEADWRQAVSVEGFFATYEALFGYPFDLAIEPVVPAGLSQPDMQLPFEPGVPWVFSGGPHPGWGTGTAWAALDFAPRGEMIGCADSEDWVVAAADGLVVRSANGAVVQDLDGDGYEQSGWTVLYMHIAIRDRVQVGQFIHAGERIGHPSCEGGVANATHLHIARRYNGEWLYASGSRNAPAFVMDGWTSVSEGILYDGVMQRGDQRVEACECRDPQNMLQR